MVESNSEMGRSSRTSALSICSMTGCDFLSSNICRISSTNLIGLWTSDCASARGLSKTIATSISPPSFLMIGERPVCIWCRTANARFSHMLARDAVCGGTLLMSGVPSACRKVLGGRRAAGLAATASFARRRSLSLTWVKLVTFLLMSASQSIHIWRIDFPVWVSIYFRFHTAPTPHCAAL